MEVKLVDDNDYLPTSQPEPNLVSTAPLTVIFTSQQAYQDFHPIAP